MVVKKRKQFYSSFISNIVVHSAKLIIVKLDFFASYTSPKGYAIVDKRLCIPKNWFNDKYKEKRTKCKLPENLYFKTKPKLSIERLIKIIDQNIISFKYILANTVYKENPDFTEIQI